MFYSGQSPDLNRTDNQWHCLKIAANSQDPINQKNLLSMGENHKCKAGWNRLKVVTVVKKKMVLPIINPKV